MLRRYTRCTFPLLFGLVFLASLLVPQALGASKSYQADHFDVDATIQEDGSLLVTETVVFRFEGGPFTYVFRELPTDYTDGITGIAASMDGAVLPTGRNAGQVEIRGRDPIKVTWHFAATSDAVHTFGLTYRMLGLVRQEADADLLLWNALPTDYNYYIASSTVRVTYPRAAGLLAAPEVRRGQAAVESSAGQATFTARDLKADSSLQVALRFSRGSLISAPPQWQTRQEQARLASPPFIYGAAALFLVGLAGLSLFWSRHRRELTPGPAAIFRPTSPPDDLPPAIAGAINGSGARPAWPNALATLFDLARRGVLRIEESPERKWYRGRDFHILLMEQPSGFGPGSMPPSVEELAELAPSLHSGQALNAVKGPALRPHEYGLLELLFATRAGLATSVSPSTKLRTRLSEVGRRLAGRWKLFAEPLKGEMRGAGLLDSGREAVMKQLLGIGIGLLIALVPALAGCILLIERFGGWPFLIVVSLFLLSMVALIMAGVFSPLSEQGAEEAARWQGFYRYLRDVTRGREPAWDLRQFERYLPYAASYGLAEGWARAFQKRGGAEIPAWFHAVAAGFDESMRAFVAMTAASHSIGGGGAAGAAGGAAGGGGSGAG